MIPGVDMGHILDDDIVFSILIVQNAEHFRNFSSYPHKAIVKKFDHKNKNGHMSRELLAGGFRTKYLCNPSPSIWSVLWRVARLGSGRAYNDDQNSVVVRYVTRQA
jgi:hypothetical protein